MSTMNLFCGDVRNAWGPMARGYLTHCFDDLLVYGVTYIFIFVAGSWRVWTLLPIRTVPEFPYSTRHSAKVLCLGWLGLLPMIIFALRYAHGVHDDFEWVAKPLASFAWLFSLQILNMEVARDLSEGWVLKTFFAASVVAATISLPTVVISSEVTGYGLVFYAYVIHYVLYLAIAILAFRFEHRPSLEAAAVGQGKSMTYSDEYVGFLTEAWRAKAWRLLSLWAPERLLLGSAFIFLFIAVPLSALALVVVGRLFNNFYYPYAPDSARGHLREYCLALIVIFTCTCVLEAVFSTLVFVAGERMASRTRRKLFHSLVRQEMAFFDATKAETLVQSLKSDVATMQRCMGDHLFHGVHCLLNIVVFLAIMFAISWKMALVLLSLAPICALVMKVQRHFTKRLGLERAYRLGRVISVLREALRNIRLVRAYVAEDHEEERFKQRLNDLHDLSYEAGLLDATSKSAVTLIVQFAIALSLYVGGILILSRQIEVGYLITFVIMSILAVSSLGQLPSLLASFTRALSVSDSLVALLDRVPNIQPKGSQIIEEVVGKLEMTSVSFGYPTGGDTLILKGLTISIPAFAMTAVVGQTGSGKSTMVGLLQRMYDASSGVVTLDGHDVRSLDSTWLREKVAVVLQEPVLFCMSVSQNIAYAQEAATQAQVEAAARFANAHELIQSLPDGYQALVGDKGVRLTAPQRLQVALARAVLTQPAVLLLDETVSGLDEATTDVVLENLARRQRTTVLFTSKPQGLKRIERVWVLDCGGVVEEGPPAQLMERRGAYYRMVTGDDSRPQRGAAADGEVLLKRRLALADALERRVTQAGFERSKAMELVDIIGEIKEAVVLEASSVGAARLLS